MLKFTTPVDIPKSKAIRIDSNSRIMLLGSCFSDSIGRKLQTHGFDCLVNPFGTLYNPASIATLLHGAISGEEYSVDSQEVFQSESDGVWHSWMHHSSFSAKEPQQLVDNLNAATKLTGEWIRECDILIVTLGTSMIYRKKDSGMLVANCHKQLDSLFVRERLKVSDIYEEWQTLCALLRTVNPKLQIIFTVSPIRHKRDGYHVNQISKGILLQAIDEMLPQLPDAMAAYFPSYEIMLDELRDYRFYAADMIHPSDVAVDYIWERFQDTFFDAQAKDNAARAHKEWLHSQHRTLVS